MATSGQVTVTIRGIDELQGKLQSSRADAPVARFLDRAAIHLQREARTRAAVDTGRLRNSIGTESPTTRMRRVGPNVDYAEDVEFGTAPHWPPPGALSGWAKRHGMEEFAIAQRISVRGTKAQPFMQPAADETEGYIATTLVSLLASEIESAFA